MDSNLLEIQTGGKVYINLHNANYNKHRFIGTIDYENKTYESVPRYKRIHLFRATNSISVPYDLIYKRNKRFLYVHVILDNKDLWTSALALKKYGNVMRFAGFETQIFLELSKWKKSKRLAQAERTNLKKGESI